MSLHHPSFNVLHWSRSKKGAAKPNGALHGVLFVASVGGMSRYISSQAEVLPLFTQNTRKLQSILRFSNGVTWACPSKPVLPCRICESTSNL